MERQSIRNEGNDAEREFARLVPGTRPSDAAKKGDVIIRVDSADHYVEIKQCQKGNTINQIRAVKFIPLVIYSPQYNKPWAVLPPQEVVRFVLQKERGQHTEIPFESANLSLSGIPAAFRFLDGDLPEAVRQAVRSATKYDAVAEELRSLQGQLAEL